jgi:hypothetical protein
MASNAEMPTPLVLLKECTRKGYVTQLREVTEQDPRALADRLGYAHHLMADGYALLLLISPVARQDFVWRDTTRFSAGWVKERVYFKAQNRLRWSDEYVQRADQDRFRFHQGDGYQSEHSWDAFLSEQERLLNVRQGSERIVKLVPFVHGNDGDYPSARRGAALQWELKVDKQFFCAAFVKRGGMIRAGEFRASHPG